MTLEQLDIYVKNFISLDCKTKEGIAVVLSYLPDPFFSNYDKIMNTIITAIDKEIKFYEDYKDENSYEDVIFDLERKKGICETYIENNRIDNLKENEFVNDKVVRNLVFASDSNNENYFLNDLSNIPKEYYDIFYSLFMQISSGIDSLDKKKNTRYIKGIHTAKDDKARIDYKFLAKGIIYIMGARYIDDEKMDKTSFIKRNNLLEDQFESLKNRFKDDNYKSSFLEDNLLEIQKVFDFFVGKGAKK